MRTHLYRTNSRHVVNSKLATTISLFVELSGNSLDKESVTERVTDTFSCKTKFPSINETTITEGLH